MNDKFFSEDKVCDVVAMAYVPWQQKAETYENLEEGFCAGTIFPELDKPFIGRRQK